MHWLIRTVWFLLVGWWLATFWVVAGFALCATIILIPMGVGMLSVTRSVAFLPKD